MNAQLLDPPPRPARPAAPRKPMLNLTSVTRILGILMLIVGLLSALMVVRRAWSLFGDQETMASFGSRIEERAHLNHYAAKFDQIWQVFNKPQDTGEMAEDGSAAPPRAAPAAANTAPTREEPLDISYLVAWFFTFLILGLIARISFWAINTGSNLAREPERSDEQLMDVLRALIKEVKAGQAR